jgi:tetratricopeptide (TPR) repeat protein
MADTAPDLTQTLAAAGALRGKNDHAGAALLLSQAKALAPDRLDIRIDLVKALSAAKDELRLREEATALETWEVDEAGWRKLVSLFRAIKDNMRAQLVTLRFLKVDPNHESANVEMIKLLCNAHRLRDAADLIQVFLRTPGLSAAALYEISQCQINLKRFEAAAATAQRGIDADETSFDARFSLAQALHMSNHSLAIRPHVNILASLAGDDIVRWGRVAEVAAWAMNKPAAEKAINRILSFETIPDGILVLLARAYCDLRSHAEALRLLDRVSQPACKDASILKKTQYMVEGINKLDGPSRLACEIGARSIRRLMELYGPTPDYQSKLTGFENCARG